jgi:glutamate synthase domain-containing protein 3
MARNGLEQLYALVREHFERTGSPRAQEVLDVRDYYRELFRKVSPRGGSAALPPIAARAPEPTASEPALPVSGA